MFELERNMGNIRPSGAPYVGHVASYNILTLLQMYFCVMSLCDLSTSGKCHLYISRENVYSNVQIAMAFRINSTYREKANAM